MDEQCAKGMNQRDHKGVSLDWVEVADRLRETALLLELQGANPFKIRAYSQAAKAVESLEADLSRRIRENSLTQISGIGDHLSLQIRQLYDTGSFPLREELKAAIPPGLLELLKVPGLGPKKIRVLHQNLQIQNAGELEYACHENRLITLPGFGLKTQDKILKGLEYLKSIRGQFRLGEALPQARMLIKKLMALKEIRQAQYTGSLRRFVEVVKDINLLVESPAPTRVLEAFLGFPEIKEVLSQRNGTVQATITSGISVELKVASQAAYPFVLLFSTGNFPHVMGLQARARDQGLSLTPEGLIKDGRPLSLDSEEAIYRALGLPFIYPELREGDRELADAAAGNLPVLVEQKDIKGLLHIHTQASDGLLTLEEAARWGEEQGLEYLGITEHSRSAAYAGGLKNEEVLEQYREIQALNRRGASLRLLMGIESDILADGSLDYSPEILEHFDFVIASVHSGFQMDEAAMTQRIVRAIENPATTILGHPTGRLLLAREPFKLDMNQVLEAAAKNRVILEINANSHRLDLDWRFVRQARAMGIKFAINPDAHHLSDFDEMTYGVGIARKGWLSREDVINTYPLTDLLALLKK